MIDSETLFNMARLNKKVGRERSDKEIMEGLFGGNVTCTSMELYHSLKARHDEQIQPYSVSQQASEWSDLVELSFIFERNLEILLNLNERITNNLKAIELTFQSETSNH